MSVSFHPTRDARSAPLLDLEHDAVEAINAALHAAGHAFHVDPYGDTKLTDWHIGILQGLRLPDPVTQALNRLDDHDVVYAMGD